MGTVFGKGSSLANGLPEWPCGRSRAVPLSIPPSSMFWIHGGSNRIGSVSEAVFCFGVD